MRITKILVIAMLWFAAGAASPQSKQEPGTAGGVDKAKAAASKTAAPAAAQNPDKGCTERPKSDWLPVEEMALLARHRGYKFERVKISYGTCYEIYGSNRDGDLVEAYFDPSNAKLMRQNVVVLPKK